MAAQQQHIGIGQMGLAQHLAQLHHYQSRIVDEEITKAYAPKQPEKNKKLLLLRK